MWQLHTRHEALLCKLFGDKSHFCAIPVAKTSNGCLGPLIDAPSFCGVYYLSINSNYFRILKLSNCRRENPQMWEYLPDVVLEEVFMLLNLCDRHNASQVCGNWYRIFYSPRVWRKFVFHDRTLVRRKFNYYMGYEHILDYNRTKRCLEQVGLNFRRLLLLPVTNFFNLYEFMNSLSYFNEFYPGSPLRQVHTLDFSFACHLAIGQADREVIFGTGGKLLEALKRLMRNLTGLKHLALRDLLLDRNDAMFLLDDVVLNCADNIRSLVLMNCTKDPYPVLHCGVLLRLRRLVVSPQQLSEEVVLLLSYTELRDLYIVQSKFTEVAYAVSAEAWKECRKIKPKLRVHLVLEGKTKTPLVWQEGAPVKSLVFATPYSRVTVEGVHTAVSLYSQDLESYVHSGLPRFHMDKKFVDRADSALIFLCRSCPRLRTLMVRELISTSTVLLLASQCPWLDRLIIRKNALIKRCDWPRSPAWSQPFHDWLRTSAKDYQETQNEVSRLLGFRWSPMPDREFKKMDLSELQYNQ